MKIDLYEIFIFSLLSALVFSLMTILDYFVANEIRLIFALAFLWPLTITLGLGLLIKKYIKVKSK